MVNVECSIHHSTFRFFSMLNGVCVNVAHWFTRHPILSLDHKHNFHTHTARATLAALTQVPHAARAQRSRSRKPETELTEHTVEFVTHDSRKLLLPPRTRPQCRLPPPRVPRATRVTRPSRSRSSTACHETAGAKSATRRFPSSRWPSPLRRTRLSTGLSWVSVDAVCAMRALRRVSSQEPRSRLR